MFALRPDAHPREFRDAYDVLAENVAFQVDEIPGLRQVQVRVLPRVGDDLHVEVLIVHTGDGQADPAHRNGPLTDDVGRQQRRVLDREPERVAVSTDIL